MAEILRPVYLRPNAKIGKINAINAVSILILRIHISEGKKKERKKMPGVHDVYKLYIQYTLQIFSCNVKVLLLSKVLRLSRRKYWWNNLSVKNSSSIKKNFSFDSGKIEIQIIRIFTIFGENLMKY